MVHIGLEGVPLSQEANNYFGIKCHGWSGRGYNIDTREETCFRAEDYTGKRSMF